MTNWPVAGGTVRDTPTERNLRDIRRRGGEVERILIETIKKGLPASGKAGGVLKGEYPNPEFAKEPAYKAELENETTARKEVDGILKGEIETEKTGRESAVKTERELREAADNLEKSKREEADNTEKAAREAGDNERVKGPASSTESDIATYNGATGKIIKDSGKTIASVLLEAEETAKALASAAAAGLSIKNPVAYATTAALTVTKATEKTLEGTVPLTIDGFSGLSTGTRVLLKNQASEAQNGIYEVTTDEAFGAGGKFGGSGTFGSGSKWILTRTKDADETEEVKQGMLVLVTLGTTNKATSWILTSENPITIGTTAQTFSAFTAKPTGAAGGVLTGTYPEPTSETSGFGVVYHGTEAETARPLGWKQVFWIGTVEPKKAAEKDPWLNPEDFGNSYRDYGLVSALPTSPAPSVGDYCSYIADKTNGVYWNLRYDGEGELKWKFIGGPALYAEVAAEEATASTSYVNLTTTGPSVALPLKGDYDIAIGTGVIFNGANIHSMSYAIGASEALDENAAEVNMGTTTDSLFFERRKTGLTAVTLTAKYKVSSASSGTFKKRWMRVTPVRVG